MENTKPEAQAKEEGWREMEKGDAEDCRNCSRCSFSPDHSKEQSHGGQLLKSSGQKLCHYLEGERCKDVPDHPALVWLMHLHKNEPPRPRLARWLMDVQALEFAVVHTAGSSPILGCAELRSRDVAEPPELCNRCMLKTKKSIEQEGLATFKEAKGLRGDLGAA